MLIVDVDDPPSSSASQTSCFEAQASSRKAQTTPSGRPWYVDSAPICHPSPGFISKIPLAQQPAAAQYNTAYAYAYYNAYAAAAYGGQLRGVGANEYMGTINPGYW